MSWGVHLLEYLAESSALTSSRSLTLHQTSSALASMQAVRLFAVLATVYPSAALVTPSLNPPWQSLGCACNTRAEGKGGNRRRRTHFNELSDERWTLIATWRHRGTRVRAAGDGSGGVEGGQTNPTALTASTASCI